MRARSAAVDAYVIAVGVAAIAGLVASLAAQGTQSVGWWQQLMLLCLLSFVAGWRRDVVAGQVTVSLAYVVAMSAVLMLGPVAGGVVGLVGAVHDPRAHFETRKRLFNGAQFAVAGLASGWARSGLGGSLAHLAAWQLCSVVAVVAATYYAVNAGLVAGVIALAQGIRFRAILFGSFGPHALPYLVYGLFALAMAELWRASVVAGVLTLLPVLVAQGTFRRYEEEQSTYDATVAALMQAVETKDLYTRGHSERVAHGSVLVARQLGMREDRVVAVRYAGMLHDVGKLGVPTPVLQKPGALTDAEFAAVRTHPAQGEAMLAEIEFLDDALAGIRHHHERVDGRGYPDGLRGDQIPELARIIAVADTLDAMTSTRSYRGARSVPEALAEIRAGTGSQFDPVMAEALIAAVERHGWSPASDMPEPLVHGSEAMEHDDVARLTP